MDQAQRRQTCNQNWWWLCQWWWHVIKDDDLHPNHDCVNDDEMMVIQQGDHRGRPAEDVQEDGPWQQWQNLKKGDFGLNLWKSELKNSGKRHKI